MAMKGGGSKPTQSQQGSFTKPTYQAINQYRYGKKGQSGAVSKAGSGTNRSY